ncbi:SulP family inorganic anion transporter, partial [Candidatus Bathyarchaeota archaeon]|nr:SulP family inorganic anion transporter [Candidatus Bathyarchaeota archaeon]
MNIAEGLAYALVAGIEPIYGLYSGIIPPIMAGLFASSAFMVVTLTSEMALMTATLFETMGNVAMSVIFMFAILVGVWQLLFGYFKLGKYLRFISSSVMTGFVTGLAVLVILGQIPELLGAHSEHSGKVLAAIDILLHPGTWDLATTFIGITMIVLIILLLKTRLHKVSLIVSLVAVSIINWLVGFTSVQIVGDIAQITRTLPLPAIPAFSAIPELLIPSLSTAILGVAVAVAVSQNYTNPDGDYPNSNKDFIGLGVANTVGGIFQSPPTTGSLSRTATIVGAGAKSRFALILSGLLMAAVLVTVGPLAEYIPMAALAGLLIFVSFEAVN